MVALVHTHSMFTFSVVIASKAQSSISGFHAINGFSFSSIYNGFVRSTAICVVVIWILTYLFRRTNLSCLFSSIQNGCIQTDFDKDSRLNFTISFFLCVSPYGLYMQNIIRHGFLWLVHVERKWTSKFFCYGDEVINLL